MQVFGCVAHVQRGRVNQALGHKARVRIGAGAHRVVAHVLHAAGNHDVVRAEADAARRGGDGGHGPGTHPVDGEAGNGAGEPGQEGCRAAEGEALVAGLGGGGYGHFVDPGRRQGGVPAQQFADAFHHQVIGAGSGVDAFLAGPAKGCADAVNKNDVADSARGCALCSPLWRVGSRLLLIETLAPAGGQRGSRPDGSAHYVTRRVT